MSSQMITMAIRQPEDPRTRQLLYEQVTYVVNLYGGRVTSTAQEDEITLRMKLTERLPAHILEEARQELAAQNPIRHQQE